jgi:hypothetical protein
MEASPSGLREAALARVSSVDSTVAAAAASAAVSSGGSTPPRRGPTVPAWLALSALIVIAANLLAGVTAWATIELMHGVSPFAREARAFEKSVLPAWRCFAYLSGIVVVLV